MFIVSDLVSLNGHVLFFQYTGLNFGPSIIYFHLCAGLSEFWLLGDVFYTKILFWPIFKHIKEIYSIIAPIPFL